MEKEWKNLEKELYFCRYIDSSNAILEPVSGGRFILVFTLSGKAQFILNDKPFEVNERKFLLLHPHVKSHIRSVSSDFRACCICSMLELQGNVTYNIPPSFIALLIQHPVWDMDVETTRAASAFCTLFDYNCKNVSGSHATNIATALFTVFVQTFYEKTKKYIPPEQIESVTVITRNVITRFMTELRYGFKTQHQVRYYAGKVCVSPKYLTQVVKRSLGLTPKEIIDRKLAVESMYLLAKSELSIQEVGNELNFPDQSYFGRFFKRMLGISPMAFRLNPDMRLMSRLKPIRRDPSVQLNLDSADSK